MKNMIFSARRLDAPRMKAFSSPIKFMDEIYIILKKMEFLCYYYDSTIAAISFNRSTSLWPLDCCVPLLNVPRGN